MSDTDLDAAERKHLEEKIVPRLEPLLERIRRLNAELADVVETTIRGIHGVAFVGGAIYGQKTTREAMAGLVPIAISAIGKGGR